MTRTLQHSLSLGDRIRSIVWAFPSGDSRRDDIRVLADDVEAALAKTCKCMMCLSEEKMAVLRAEARAYHGYPMSECEKCQDVTLFGDCPMCGRRKGQAGPIGPR